MGYLGQRWTGGASGYLCASSFEILPSGVRFRSEISFEIGVGLALDLRTGGDSTTVTGFVVECVPADDECGAYDVTAYVGLPGEGSPFRGVRRNGASVV